ncbi:hypothetical protein [Yersinia sp. Marseille-Q3913]|uniref:hypothetical protein n=1 Tax=Yersinia sp. Marseille-Q3913 TaxID=2830769 RepID=UPI001BAFE583|nr:hypothetical protein [Yersinia sp. Marseille-Q3913]MBS0054165.1 hypothetical protein [Yersinia sp. Marseille-Q3913]
MNNKNEEVIRQINSYKYKWFKNPNKERVIYYSFDKTPSINILDYLYKFDHHILDGSTKDERMAYSSVSLIDANETLIPIVRLVLTDLGKNIGLEFHETENIEESNLHFLTLNNKSTDSKIRSNIGLTLPLSKENSDHSIITIESGKESSYGLVAHEIGHALGLTHLELEYDDGTRHSTVMSNINRSFTNKDSKYFSVNDIAALQLSYGPDTHHVAISPQAQKPIIDHTKDYKERTAPEKPTIPASPVIPSVITTTNTTAITYENMEYYYHRVHGNKEIILSLWRKLHQSNFQYDASTLTTEEINTLRLVQETRDSPQEKKWNHWNKNIASVKWINNHTVTTINGSNENDYIHVSQKNKDVNGLDGNDYINIDIGEHNIAGGAGSDIYNFGAYLDQKNVINSTGNTQDDFDEIKLDGIYRKNLWLKKEGVNLIISNRNSRSELKITDYYKKGLNTIKQITVNDEILTGSNINKLVEAMGAYDSSDKGVSSSQQYHTVSNQCWITLPSP